MPHPSHHSSRSDEVHEILGTPPGWLVRSGILLALATVVILGWIGYLVRYPDVVKDRIRITSVDPPRRLISENTVFVEKILVENEDTVAAGQTIMVFNSAAQFEDVHILEDYLLAARESNDSALLHLKLPRDLLLGELQEPFYDFLERQEVLQMRRSGQIASLSIDQLRRRIAKERSTIRSERRQKENLEKRLDLARKNYIREQNLERERLSTIDRVRTRQEEVLSYERMIAGSESMIKNKTFEIQQMQREIEGVRSDSDITESEAASDLQDAYSNLLANLETWKRRHVLVAPINGTVVLRKDVREKQYVMKEDELAIILPINAGGIVGRMDLGLRGSGKVKEGQKVVVKFDSYPFAEFGAVVGEIAWKGRIPTNERIPIEVTFPQGLKTTTERQLEASQDMAGTAEIVTDEKRFLSWIFESLRG